MKIDRLIEELNQTQRVLEKWQSCDNVPVIERDIVLGNLQNIYRTVLNITTSDGAVMRDDVALERHIEVQRSVMGLSASAEYESDFESDFDSEVDSEEWTMDEAVESQTVDLNSDSAVGSNLSVDDDQPDEVAAIDGCISENGSEEELEQEIDELEEDLAESMRENGVEDSEIPSESELIDEDPSGELDEDRKWIEIDGIDGIDEELIEENDVVEEGYRSGTVDRGTIIEEETEVQIRPGYDADSEAKAEVEATEADPGDLHEDDPSEDDRVEMLGQLVSKELRQDIIRELFVNDQGFFENEMSKITRLADFEEALIYISEKYNWSASSIVAEEFTSMLAGYEFKNRGEQ